MGVEPPGIDLAQEAAMTAQPPGLQVPVVPVPQSLLAAAEEGPAPGPQPEARDASDSLHLSQRGPPEEADQEEGSKYIGETLINVIKELL